MVPFVLPNIMLVAEQASEADFTKHVFPAFIPLFRITDPVQVIPKARTYLCGLGTLWCDTHK